MADVEVDRVRILGSMLNSHPLVQKLRAATYCPNGDSYGSVETRNCSICDESYGLFYFRIIHDQHSFCMRCVRQWLTTLINEGALEIKCPHAGCAHVMPYAFIAGFLKADRQLQRDGAPTLKRYDDNLKYHALSMMPDIRFCPVCHVGMALAAQMCGRDVVCVSCQFTFCSECLTGAHGTQACNAVQRTERDAAAIHEAKLVAEYKEKNAKRCPNCSVVCVRDGGCSHMTCRRCNHQWCWICLRKYQGKQVANDQTKCTCTDT